MFCEMALKQDNPGVGCFLIWERMVSGADSPRPSSSLLVPVWEFPKP